MGKVLRLHTGNNTLKGWDNSAAYDKNAIDGIPDPEGNSTAHEITSIPSPFARIDLVKTAFEKVASSNEVDGETMHHKIVSDALDVAQIFFNLDKLSDKVEMIVWNKDEHIQELLNSDNPKHRQLGETLDLYLKRDKGYNFDKLEHIYLLNYKQGPNLLNIIGGTSPSTLFFTNANDLSYASDIQFENDRVFDDNYCSLKDRETEFVKYLYALKASSSTFSVLFKEVNDYLELNFQYLKEETKSDIRSFDRETISEQFQKLTFDTGGNHSVEIIDNLHLYKGVKPDIEQLSDFVIASSAKVSTKPLVLPNDIYTNELSYTSGKWDRTYKAPYYDPRRMEERTLPYLQDEYPYLTIEDLLQPYFIKTVFPVSSSNFYVGNSKGFGETEGFILPIKPKLFEYFKSDFLNGVTREGKPNLEITQLNTGGITVILRIPIKGGNHVTFKRTYYPSASPDTQLPEIDLEKNKGGILTNTFSVSIYPNFKLGDENRQGQYRIALFDHDTSTYGRSNNYSISLGSFEQTESTSFTQRDRSRIQSDAINSKFHLTKGSFDFIEVNDGNNHKGIIVPKFKSISNGTCKFRFAIDFGTTNTHIEYQKDNSKPKPFEINNEDIQLLSLHDTQSVHLDDALRGAGFENMIQTLIEELKPDFIGKDHLHKFPQRTALGYKKDLDFSQNVYPMADFNIPFFYERSKVPPSVRIKTNLKWSIIEMNDQFESMVQGYFENILLLIRNKILLNGGNLDETDLIWFYPSSMSTTNIDHLNDLWQELAIKYISQNVSPVPVSESLAPFYYYNNNEVVGATDRPVVSIDIGGGTTDVVIFNDRDKILTSFKFAGNSIFGDGYNSNINRNGFVQKYKEKINNKIPQNLQYVLSQILENQHSEDVIAFFFALENNISFLENNNPISFTKMLSKDAELKSVFVVFYAAIFYHIAKLIKAAELETPRYIIFSGTASGTMEILSKDEQKSGIQTLAEEVFKYVLDDNDQNIEIKTNKKPKEITSKGGLLMPPGENNNRIKEIKKVLVHDSMVSSFDSQISYDKIEDEILNSVLNEYKDYVHLLERLESKIDFKDTYGIDRIRMAEVCDILLQDSREYLKTGLEKKRSESRLEAHDPIDEPLFFYPLIQALNNLAYKVTSNES
jgi:hypothetical protein